MTPAELSKILEGVPEGALPSGPFRSLVNINDTIDDDSIVLNAAVGAMLAWLAVGHYSVSIAQNFPTSGTWEVVVDCDEINNRKSVERRPTLIEALAAACRAVAKENAR